MDANMTIPSQLSLIWNSGPSGIESVSRAALLRIEITLSMFDLERRPRIALQRHEDELISAQLNNHRRSSLVGNVTIRV